MNTSRATRPQVLHHQHKIRKRVHDHWYFLFSVRHGVIVPIRLYLMMCSFKNQMLAQLDWLRYWHGTTAYKTDVYILPKLLGEKVATLHLLCSVRRSRSTQFLRLPPEFCGLFGVILRASRLQMLCQLQFCLSSTS